MAETLVAITKSAVRRNANRFIVIMLKCYFSFLHRKVKHYAATVKRLFPTPTGENPYLSAELCVMAPILAHED